MADSFINGQCGMKKLQTKQTLLDKLIQFNSPYNCMIISELIRHLSFLIAGPMNCATRSLTFVQSCHPGSRLVPLVVAGSPMMPLLDSYTLQKFSPYTFCPTVSLLLQNSARNSARWRKRSMRMRDRQWAMRTSLSMIMW